MRIGIELKALKNSKTGISRYIRNILNELQQIDKSNEYFLFEKNESDYTAFNPRWKKINISSLLPGTLWLLFIIPYYCRKFRIDLFWGPEYTIPLFGTGNIPCVATIHDLSFLHYKHTMQRTNRWTITITIPFVLRKARAIFTDSDFIKRDLLNSFGNTVPMLEEKTFAIPLGKPHWSLPADYRPENRKRFLFFPGNFEPRKNLINLFKALEILQNNGLEIPLHISGTPGWKQSEALQFLKNSSVKKNVNFMGFLSEEQLQLQYRNCKALVFPSLYEGFGLPVLEALLLDCLVLTSKGTVMEEIGGNNCVYFDPTKPQDIATKIKTIYCKDFYRFEYLKHSHKILKLYSWEKSVRLIISVFSTLKLGRAQL